MTRYVRFSLIPSRMNPAARVIALELFSMAIIASLALFLVAAIGRLSLNAALFFSIGSCAAALLVTPQFIREFQGAVDVDQQGFTLKSGMGSSRFLWSHIDHVGIGTVSETGWVSRLLARTAFVPGTRQFVAVKLRRRPRLSLLPWRGGTTVTLGVPQLFTTTIHLYLVEPERFVDAVAQYCGSAGDEGPASR